MLAVGVLQHNSVSVETPPPGPWDKAYHSSFCGEGCGGVRGGVWCGEGCGVVRCVVWWGVMRGGCGVS